MDKRILTEIRRGKNTEQLANADKYNEGIRESWLPFWVKNAAENYDPIKAMFKEGDCDISVMQNQEQKPVLVIGSGPSLNDWEPYLKDWEGDIYISSSHLAYFEAIEVTPTACFIIDADPNMTYLVSEANTKAITLITHANMEPEVLKAWDGPVRFFRMNDPGDDWFGKYMPLMYSEFAEVVDHGEVDPKERNWGGASGQFKGNKAVWPGIRCFVLNSGNVSNTMIALSQFIGGRRNVFLCGVDLGFPDGQYRFNGYRRTKEGFEPHPDEGIPKERAIKEGHNGVKTDQVSCFYKYSTLILYGMDAPNIYTCSRGILTEVPYISPKDVLACQGDVPERHVLADREKYQIAQTYLRHRGIYIMKGLGKSRTKATTDFMRSKKRIMRYMMFTSWLKNKTHPLNKETKKNIIHGMWNAPMVKFRLKYWEWTFGPEETIKARLGSTGITNRHHLRGAKGVMLRVKFTLGRWLKIW